MGHLRAETRVRASLVCYSETMALAIQRLQGARRLWYDSGSMRRPRGCTFEGFLKKPRGWAECRVFHTKMIYFCIQWRERTSKPCVFAVPYRKMLHWDGSCTEKSACSGEQSAPIPSAPLPLPSRRHRRRRLRRALAGSLCRVRFVSASAHIFTQCTLC